MKPYLTIQENERGLVQVIFDHPAESVNTLHAALLPAFAELLDRLQGMPNLSGVILLSAKPDNFIVGADLRMLEACQDAQAARALAAQGQRMFNQLASLPCPTVAMIHGACLGGGLELALACDYRVGSDASVTRLGLPEIQLGLIPGSGGTQCLPRLIGLPSALDLLLTGRTVSAQRAKRMGLLDLLVPQANLMVAAQALLARGKQPHRLAWRERLMLGLPPLRKAILNQARKQAAQKSRGNYPAPERLIAAVETGLLRGIPAGLESEALHFGDLVPSSQSQGLRSLFHATTAHKKFKHYQGAEPLPIRAVGVLGAGLMGSGIAQVTACQAGLPVRLKDTQYDSINRAFRHIAEALSSRQHGMDAYTKRAQLARLSGTLDYQGFRQLDLVIEAVFEDLDLKQQMIQEVQAVGHSGLIFASNTSSLPIVQLAAKAIDPSRVIGLHYFSPVEKMPLVEVIPHIGTAPEVVSSVLAVARQQGKTPVVVRDVAGFFVNRILAPYLNEAATLLLEGETISSVDQALLQAGFPVGPLALLDEVGLEVAAKIGPILEAAYGARFSPCRVLPCMLADGRKGRKSRLGFYRYPIKGTKVADHRLYDVLNTQPKKQLPANLIEDRCQLLMLNEAVRCLDEQVVACARDGDLAAVLGLGYPPFEGGPFRHLDRLGLHHVVARLQQFADQYGERFAPCEGLLRRAHAGERFYPA